MKRISPTAMTGRQRMQQVARCVLSVERGTVKMKRTPLTATARILVLRSSTGAPSAEWQELKRRLPEAEQACDAFEAAESLRTRTYELVLADSALADAILPGGSFFGLLGLLIARQHSPTLVVQVCLPEGPRWVKLIDNGAFNPSAEPMKSERFLCWLEDWLDKSSPSERVEAA